MPGIRLYRNYLKAELLEDPWVVPPRSADERSDFVLLIRWVISLDPAHHAAMRALLCGLPMDEVADRAGVADRTLLRWFKLEFREGH